MVVGWLWTVQNRIYFCPVGQYFVDYYTRMLMDECVYKYMGIKGTARRTVM